ncbi:MAG: ferric reductase-like transmembrane domain-containing protein, partial [Gaiellaceae bacterium]
YVARAGGTLAFALLTASVVLGLLLSRKDRVSSWPRFALEDVHRFVGLLAGTFIVIHGGALLLDGYLPFSLANLVVPLSAPYRPLAVSAGVVAAELLAALAIAYHYRQSLPYAFWRKTHYLNFLVWLLALVHGITAGTDSTTPWGIGLYLGSAGLVGALVAGRFLPAERPVRQSS